MIVVNRILAESYRSYVSYGHTYGLQKRIIPDLEL